jgi:hypothetical protein
VKNGEERIFQEGWSQISCLSFPSHFCPHAVFTRESGRDERRVTGFVFVCVSQAPTLGGVVPRININGSGTFNSSEAQGGGSYDQFDNASPVPRTILGAGRWRARRVLSFKPIGTYGVLASGILEIDVRLLQEIPSRAVIPATLRVACSIGAAGFDAGELEGITLTIPGGPFGPFRLFLLAPGVTQGITIFTTSGEED